RYKAQFALWTNLNAPNTYGNTGAWVTALNYGQPGQSLAGYTSAVVQPNPYPSGQFGQLDPMTQATIQNQLRHIRPGTGHDDRRADHPGTDPIAFGIVEPADF